MNSTRLALSATLVLLAGRAAAQHDGDGAPQLEHFDRVDVDYESASLDDPDIGAVIYLPKGYGDAANADRVYPFAVWLHGFGGFGQFEARGGAAALDALRGAGEIPELIFVLWRIGYGAPRTTYIDGEMFGDVERAIHEDLVDHLQANYRVARRPAQRALMGVSVGGYGALKIVMRHPDVFGVAAAHSAPIFPADPAALTDREGRRVEGMMQLGLVDVFGDPIDRARWAAEMPLGIAGAADLDQLSRLALYFDAGTDDRYGFLAGNEKLAAVLTERGVAHTFRAVQGGGHAWASASMVPNLRASLRFVGAAFARAAAAAAGDGADRAADRAADRPAGGEAGGRSGARGDRQRR